MYVACTYCICSAAYVSLTDVLWMHLSGNRERDAPSIVLPHQDASYISHIALDIGGSLVKLVYFSSDKPDARSRSSSSNQPGTGGTDMLADDTTWQQL